MRVRRLILFAGLIIAAAIVALLFREPAADGANATSDSVTPPLAKNSVGAQYLSGANRRDVLPPLLSPAFNLVPDLFASPAKKMQRLATVGDSFSAQLQAVRSGDPLLIAHSVFMTLHCMDMPVQLHGKSVRNCFTEHSFDPKTGKKLHLMKGSLR